MAKYNGYDGAIAIGAMNTIEFKSWSATISRVASDVSGFSNPGRDRKLGKWDIRLSFSGTPQGGSSSPIAAQTSSSLTTTFKLMEGTGTNDTLVTFDGVVEEIQLGSVHDGDASASGTVSLATTNTNSPPFTVSWLTS